MFLPNYVANTPLKGNQFSGSVIPLKDDGGLYSSIVRFGVDKAKQLRGVAARIKAAIMAIAP
jgi:hypothetical protein